MKKKKKAKAEVIISDSEDEGEIEAAFVSNEVGYAGSTALKKKQAKAKVIIIDSEDEGDIETASVSEEKDYESPEDSDISEDGEDGDSIDVLSTTAPNKRVYPLRDKYLDDSFFNLIKSMDLRNSIKEFAAAITPTPAIVNLNTSCTSKRWPHRHDSIRPA